MTPELREAYLADALKLLAAPDPDGETVKIRSAWRDLSCKESGPEVYRRVLYPTKTVWEWPDGDRLAPKGGYRAAERRDTVYAEVPLGTLVAQYERTVYKGKRGRCSVSFSIVLRNREDPSKPLLLSLEHRTLRSRPVYEVALPDGTKLDVPRT